MARPLGPKELEWSEVATTIVWRLCMLIPVMFIISVVVFLMIHAAPGDPVTLISGHLDITQEQKDALRRELGLLDPLYVQYGRWLAGAIKGDFGESFYGQRSVASLIRDRLPATLELTILAMLLALMLGLPAGIISAYKKYTWFDNGSMLVALAGVSLPSFWVGLVAIYVFCVKLRLLPVSGRLDAALEVHSTTGLLLVDSLLQADPTAFFSALAHLILPAAVLGSVQTAYIARMTRACTLEVLNEDYIRTARAKGLSERVVLLTHAFRNALIPVVTVVGLQLGYLLGGTVIIETVFAWPGLGKLLVDSVLSRDYPVVLGVVVLGSGIFVLINLAVDLLYTALDPRMRVE
jgi:peptide/nickel transport system permease protein